MYITITKPVENIAKKKGLWKLCAKQATFSGVSSELVLHKVCVDSHVLICTKDTSANMIAITATVCVFVLVNSHIASLKGWGYDMWSMPECGSRLQWYVMIRNVSTCASKPTWNHLIMFVNHCMLSSVTAD